MDFKEKIETLAKLSKRANTRLKALEDNGIKNSAYTKVTSELGKTRFYQGTKYSSEREVTEKLNIVNEFLNDKESKLRNNKNYHNKALQGDSKVQKEHNKIVQVSDARIKSGTIDNATSELRRLSKVANQRLKTLEKSDNKKFAYKNAMEWLNEKGRTRFYTGRKYKNTMEMREQLKVLTDFLNAKTSTLTGIKSIKNTRIETFEKKLGMAIKSEKDFFDFLSSSQFKNMSRYADSDQIVEDFVSAMHDNFTVDEIRRAYIEFENSNLTFEQVAEVRKHGGNLFK